MLLNIIIYGYTMWHVTGLTKQTNEFKNKQLNVTHNNKKRNENRGKETIKTKNKHPLFPGRNSFLKQIILKQTNINNKDIP